MAKGVNKAILLGNLGNDPDIRYTQGGACVANLSLATTATWKDSSGEKQEQTEWHKVVMFGRLGEIAGEYLKKGSQIYIEGRIQTKKWQDKEGKDRYTTEIIANEMQMLGERQPGGEQQSNSSQSTDKPADEPQQAQADFDDDIPF